MPPEKKDPIIGPFTLQNIAPAVSAELLAEFGDHVARGYDPEMMAVYRRQMIEAIDACFQTDGSEMAIQLILQASGVDVYTVREVICKIFNIKKGGKPLEQITEATRAYRASLMAKRKERTEQQPKRRWITRRRTALAAVLAIGLSVSAILSNKESVNKPLTTPSAEVDKKSRYSQG